MLCNYSFKNRYDLIYFKKGSSLSWEAEKSCIFTINFDKVISYNVKNTAWYFDYFFSAVAISIMFDGGVEYVLMKKDFSLEQLTFDNSEWVASQYSLKFIFDNIINK